MRSIIWLIFLTVTYTSALKLKKANSTNETTQVNSSIGCFCGVFMGGQFKKGSKEQPKGKPILSQKQSVSSPCNLIGNRICLNSCLSTVSIITSLKILFCEMKV